MYETACEYIDEDDDLIALYSQQQQQQEGDQQPHCHDQEDSPDVVYDNDDENLTLPPMLRARALHIKAGECAYRSAR